jgi:hypothetical protein
VSIGKPQDSFGVEFRGSTLGTYFSLDK